jgi:16S rRNA (cytosine967-C5)-methyltransferase
VKYSDRKTGSRSRVTAVRTRALREDLVMQACLEAYGAVRHENRLADRALDNTLRHKRMLYSTERRAVAERVYGLLRKQRLVDFVLERARPGFSSLGATRQDLLRICAAQVLSGAQVDLAAVPEGDRAALGKLDQAQRALDKLPDNERYAIESSLPDFLAERFLRELGKEALVGATAMNERAPLTARVNTLKTSREALIARLKDEGVGAKPTQLSPFGLHLEDRLNAFSLPAFRDGLFELMDEGSQLLGMLVDAPPTKVVDTCAGAGGKTLQLAAQMKNRGDLYAFDIDARRLEDLKLRARRDGVHNVRIHVLPQVPDLNGKADRVLVDAPCSGTGAFRRKPDARYRLTPETLAEHVARQRALLEQFSPMVKPGGRLIYGTCSILREENEDVVEGFLAKHEQFEVMPADKWIDPAAVRDGFLRTFPHQHGTDGFFGAVLQRKRT